MFFATRGFLRFLNPAAGDSALVDRPLLPAAVIIPPEPPTSSPRRSIIEAEDHDVAAAAAAAACFDGLVGGDGDGRLLRR
jgi:hypothetical protein